MDNSLSKALVRTILEHAEDYPWVLQEIGVEYGRVRYTPPNEDDRRSDTVRLSGTATTFTAGQQYHQLAHELHDSRQLPGTVTLIRRTFTPEVSELTVCNRGETGWISGRSCPAQPADVKRITATALGLF